MTFAEDTSELRILLLLETNDKTPKLLPSHLKNFLIVNTATFTIN